MKHKMIYSTSLKKKKEVKRKKRQKCTNKKIKEKNSQGIKHFTGKKILYTQQLVTNAIEELLVNMEGNVIK